MKEIYFKDPQEGHSFKHITRLATKKMTQASPKMSAQIATKLLCNPGSRRDYNLSTNIQPNAYDLNTSLGLLRLYYFKGGSRHILLGHGWGDSTARFKYLINYFTSQGFSVWSMDHLGHGKSSGSVSHLFAYKVGWQRAINYITQCNHKLEAVIAHSMSSFSLLSLSKEILPRKKILISTPPQFFNSMFDKISAAGISKTTVVNLLDHLSEQYGESWHNFQLENHISKIDKNTLFIHDKEDKIADYNHLMPFMVNQSKSYISSGLGHIKLLKSENLFLQVQDFLNEKK